METLQNFSGIMALVSSVISVILWIVIVRLYVQFQALKEWLEHEPDDDDRLERNLRLEMAENRRETSQTLAQNREELNAILQRLDSALNNRLEQSRNTLENRLESAQSMQQDAQEQLRRLVDEKLTQAQTDAREGRQEMGMNLQRFGESQAEQTASLSEVLTHQMQTFSGQLSLQLTTLTQTNEQGLLNIKTALEQRLAQSQQDAREGRVEQSNSLAAFGEQLAVHLNQLMQRNTEGMETLRHTLETRLAAIQTDNGNKLEQMRLTVDEKLHNTLEQRLGDSFKLVSERLEQVHKGLGEMQTLASGVGDLKKVLTNVKVRGTWGEVQLEQLLDQVLTPEQYAKNVQTRPNSNERVEFAIRLPGRDSANSVVWLPIDAKFPLEDYQRFLDAQENGDIVAMDTCGKALETRIREEARSIRNKYLEPPHTTDFGLLFLPVEGLYAEVIRRPGLCDFLQRECRVTVTGPTTLTAILNSLQMGFRTLAIEKRSSEVWQVLGAVKTEFGKFGDVLAKTKKKLDEARNTIDDAEVRTRAIDRKLRVVESLPLEQADSVLKGLDSPSAQAQE